MVNPELEIYLTDFLNRTFADEIAKNRDFRGESKFQCAPVYHARINHPAAVWRAGAPLARPTRTRKAEERKFAARSSMSPSNGSADLPRYRRAGEIVHADIRNPLF